MHRLWKYRTWRSTACACSARRGRLMHLLVHRVLFVVLLTSTLVLNFCLPPFSRQIKCQHRTSRGGIPNHHCRQQKTKIHTHRDCFRGIPPPPAMWQFCGPAVWSYQKTCAEFLLNKRPRTHQRATHVLLRLAVCFSFFFFFASSMTRFCAKSFVINLQLTLGPPPLSLQLHTLTGCQQALQREPERQRERDTQRKNSSLQSSSKPFLYPLPPPPPPHSPDVSLTSRLFTTLESKPCPLVLHIHSLPPARSSTKQKKKTPLSLCSAPPQRWYLARYNRDGNNNASDKTCVLISRNPRCKH